jgi:hypothetical protein
LVEIPGADGTATHDVLIVTLSDLGRWGVGPKAPLLGQAASSALSCPDQNTQKATNLKTKQTTKKSGTTEI